MTDKTSDACIKGGADAGEPSKKSLYCAPAIPPPSLKRVKSLADQMKLDLTDKELEEMTVSLGRVSEVYTEVYRMVEPKPPVKYPRTPGYRPKEEENPYNAWYVKSDIHGAPKGKLAGKSVAIKDSICVAGVPMMIGSKMMEGYIPSYDATVVTRVLDAGGNIKGKAACENFCCSVISCTNDTGPVLNPHDPTKTAGGSSSGSAVLVALGEVDLAIGGDQGGSIRNPASWCGIVGLKPTFGLIPYTGAASMEHTVDHLGPMARNVKDCAMFLEVLAGYDDGMDDRQPEFFPALPEYSKELNSNLSGMKIGMLKEGFLNCDPEVVDVVGKAAEALETKGASVEEVSIPLHNSGLAIWSCVVVEGGYETMAVRGGAGPSSKGFHDTFMMDHQTKAFQTQAHNMSFIMKSICLTGKYLQEINNHHFYCRGANLTIALTRAYDEKLKEYDVLIMPTTPRTAPELPPKEIDNQKVSKSGFGSIRNSKPFNLTGHPALSINAGQIEGLPVGLMIVGKKWHEQDVLNVAFAHEQLNT